jgi:hypothetical protein
MRAPLLALPILMTLLVSGCTIPGFPCIPGLTCGQVVEETHDVIVIESLQALPNNVPPGGTIKLVAIVSNVADVNAEIKNVDVAVELYDYCEGLFKLTDSSGGSQSNDKKTLTTNLLRSEKQQVEWTLQALPRSQVPVKTECNLKIRAQYPYATKSITTLHMIDYAEMQRRISEGTYKEIGSYQSIGYGPIKPYIYVEGTQPIPVENNQINTVLSLQIKNRGRGFLSAPSTQTDATAKKNATGPVISKGEIKITALKGDDMASGISDALKKCKDENFPPEGLKLIRGESTKIICPIPGEFPGNVPVESTKVIQASIGEIENGKPVNGYWYEFRKEIKVTVEPRF